MNLSEVRRCRCCGETKLKKCFRRNTSGNYGNCIECAKAKNRKAQLRIRLKKYGLSMKQYQTMQSEQEGCCAICGIKPKLLNVDHCHQTGKVRGLLCRHCNHMLGNAKDNGAILEAGMVYLGKHFVP